MNSNRRHFLKTLAVSSAALALNPRAALLGTLAGVSITFISMAPALQMFMTPVIGIPALSPFSRLKGAGGDR